MIMPIKRLLIANRGEIACRIMQTARRMNIETLAIYSAADKHAMHVRLADQAYYIGEPEPQKSYLNQDKILELAHKNHVWAIHPGYGFLSENFEFSKRCQKEDVIFVGPNSESIRAMGIKNESKRIMIEAGVPVVPGYHGLVQDNQLLLDEARKIGYPIMIKPVRGGGGKGMRVVRREEDFIEALESSRRESLKSFNDESILLEKFIEKPRHIEVQVFGDLHGNYVYLFERDCSVQRRHQKIIEEAPAPLLSSEKRAELGKQAVAAAKAVNYIGAGTVEFILDKLTEEFYFMEMNTRLQVEHPITEMITNTDLVEWQLRIADGEELPRKQEDLTISGHAFEARIYAENPKDNFLPQIGKLNHICLPDNIYPDGDSTERGHSSSIANRGFVRLDTGVTQGDTISPYYDPMIAKLVVWAQDRQTALSKLDKALNQYKVIGVQTNLNFLSQLANNKHFREADVGVDFIDLHYDELFQEDEFSLNDLKHGHCPSASLAEICAAIYGLVSRSTRIGILDKKLASFRGLGLTKGLTYKFKIELGDNCLNLLVEYESFSANSGKVKVTIDEENLEQANSGATLECNTYCELIEDDEISVRFNNQREVHRFKSKSSVLTCSELDRTILILRSSSGQNRVIKVKRNNQFKRSDGKDSDMSSDPLVARAPMPGVIEKVLVSKGDFVKKGQNLLIMSAMKMEYTIKSSINGQVVELNNKAGDFVAKESILVRLDSS